MMAAWWLCALPNAAGRYLHHRAVVTFTCGVQGAGVAVSTLKVSAALDPLHRRHPGRPLDRPFLVQVGTLPRAGSIFDTHISVKCRRTSRQALVSI